MANSSQPNTPAPIPAAPHHIASALAEAAGIKTAMEAYDFVAFKDEFRLYHQLSPGAREFLDDFQPWNLPCETGQIDLCEAEDLAELKERIETHILEQPISVDFNLGWHQRLLDAWPEEYRILLSTGGPAVRLVGQLSEDGVSSATLEAQDWFIPWEPLSPAEHPEIDEETLIDYADIIVSGYLPC